MGVPNTLLEFKTRAPVQGWAVPICEKTHLTQNINISRNLTKNEIRRWFNGERIILEKKADRLMELDQLFAEKFKSLPNSSFVKSLISPYPNR
jgi:hypothetical protein